MKTFSEIAEAMHQDMMDDDFYDWVLEQSDLIDREPLGKQS